ncbi:MAG TPA: hypothetical protein VGE39_19355 [Prosthecobacter sp.]
MSHDATAELLARLEAGFRANSAQLRTLENQLGMSVRRGREFGEKHGGGPVLQMKWNSVEESLRRFQRLATEVDKAPEGDHDQEGIEKGLEALAALQGESARLKAALQEVRAAAASPGEAAWPDWNTLAQVFEEELEALHDCVDMMRVRLELHDGRSEEEVRRFVRDVLLELRERPMPELEDARKYQMEYLKAAIETAHEKHESLGFPRIIKTLFTWYENPEERVRRKLFLPID